jgi:hypothetical protein
MALTHTYYTPTNLNIKLICKKTKKGKMREEQTHTILVGKTKNRKPNRSKGIILLYWRAPSAVRTVRSPTDG